jgi:hypothetical protein
VAVLEPGLDLTVTVAANDLSKSFAIHTADASAELSVPSFGSLTWERLTEDFGDTISCERAVPSGLCGQLASVGVQTRDLYDTNITANVVTPAAVAWEVSIAEIEGKGTFANAEPWPTIVLYAQQLDYALSFAEQRDQYCVSVVMRNLRNDDEQSGEFCSSPPATIGHVSADSISECAHPPSPELTGRWCAANGFDPTHPECAPVPAFPKEGTAGSANSMPPSMSAEPSSDSGCAIARAPSQQRSLDLLAVLALAMLRKRRRGARSA